jgi:hypothetical protein
VQHSSDQDLIRRIDTAHARVGADQRALFRLIAEADGRGLWHDFGARDTAHWLSIRYGLSDWKARRWITAAHALEALPAISEALESGVLGVDKVVELTRFATADSEHRLTRWAVGVSCGAIRRAGDLEARRTIEDVQEPERMRFLEWWYSDEGRRFGLQAEFPASQGAVVAKAIERLAESLPVMPDEEGLVHADARRADALVALCSTRLAEDPDPDRATIVVHAPLAALTGPDANAEIEDGPVIAGETARRLACNARIQMVLEDEDGQPLRLGRLSRDPSAAMLRQLRYRDRECTFPSCGARRFTHAHHLVWWQHGGRTDLDNLVLVCSFHHRLVHEHGWRLERELEGNVRWFRPDGRRYHAGPAPPMPEERPPELMSIAS